MLPRSQRGRLVTRASAAEARTGRNRPGTCPESVSRTCSQPSGPRTGRRWARPISRSPTTRSSARTSSAPAVQRQRLPKDVYKKLSQTLAKGEALDTSLADAVALAMKEWALEKGATHYAHMFQPLTGLTAEKHDSFYAPTGEGTALASFSGKELIQAEPDAS